MDQQFFRTVLEVVTNSRLVDSLQWSLIGEGLQQIRRELLRILSVEQRGCACFLISSTHLYLMLDSFHGMKEDFNFNRRFHNLLLELRGDVNSDSVLTLHLSNHMFSEAGTFSLTCRNCKKGIITCNISTSHPNSASPLSRRLLPYSRPFLFSS